MIDSFIYDLRFAVRGLVRDRTFAFATVIILALTIGLNVTAWGVMDATLFRGYPFVKQNERLVFIDERYPGPGCCVTFADFEAWRARSHSFEGLSFAVGERVTLGEDAQHVRDVEAMAWSPNSFGLLRVTPALGRDFRPSDAQAGAERVVILNHRYWMARMGGRASVIGGTVFVNQSPATVIGVMPQGFDFPQRVDIWMPLVETAELRRGFANGSTVVGRLADGVSEAVARAEVEAINAQLALESPATNRDVRPVVRSFMDAFAGPNGQLIYGSLWAGTWLVLVIGCANLANLALARAQGRVREICTRMALGAGRGRVVRQWFVESLLLASAGGLLAWWLSAQGLQLWSTAIAPAYQIRNFSASAATIAYLVVVTVLAAAVTTLAPVSRLWTLDVNGALQGDARGTTMSLHAKHLSAALVTGQMALAIVLMSGAGVLGHSLWNMLTAEIGVRERRTC